jgi:ribosomal protein L16 Arg81 hydroxylase
MALRAPAFRVVKGGATLTAATYTRRARIGSRTVTDLIDVGRVYGHFGDGATIVLQGLHRYWPPVAELCRQLESLLTHPLQANAYITPPVAQGLRVHADAHDVFALQTHGRKHWVVYEGGQPAPDGSGATPSLDIQLWPGDCLYLPKGTSHAARTVDTSSIHLTLGVRATTYADVLRGVVDRAVDDPAFTDPLPAGFAHDPQVLTAELQRRLATVADAIRGADVDEVAERAARRTLTSRTPTLTGQLQQLLAAGDVYDRSRIRRRPHAVCDVTRHTDTLQVVLADRTLTMPASVEPALAYVLDHEQFTVGELSEHLDAEGRVTLVRRLVREGLLMVVDE